MEQETQNVQSEANMQVASEVKSSGKGTAALVLGILAMIAWILPIVGLPVGIVGLVLGIKSLNSNKRTQAIVAITLSIIGLFLTVVNGAIGAYVGYERATTETVQTK